jgi:hypothetical protein
MVGRWGQWSPVRGAALRGRLRGRGMRSSIHGFSCLQCGLALRMPQDGGSARGPTRGWFRRSPNGRRRCCGASGRKGCCPSGTSWPTAYRAIVPIFSRRLRRVWEPRRGWLSPLKRAGGPSGRHPRSRPLGLKAQSGRSATCVRPPARRRASRLWPRPCRRGRGIGGQARKAPKGPWRMTLRGTA